VLPGLSSSSLRKGDGTACCPAKVIICSKLGIPYNNGYFCRRIRIKIKDNLPAGRQEVKRQKCCARY